MKGLGSHSCELREGEGGTCCSWSVDVQAEFQSMVVGHANSEGNGGEVIRRLSAFCSCHL